MRSVALVYPRANLDTVPSLVGAVELLAAHDYDVEVFTTFAAGQPAPAFASPRVRLRSLGVEGALDVSTASLRNAARRVTWVPRVARAPLSRGYATLSAGLSRGSQIFAQARTGIAARPAGYRCVIGVDPDGLALAFKLARGAPVVYHSLELLLSDELSTPADERLKATERTQSRHAAFVIVQDEERARLLADDNRLPFGNMVLVPNSPPGPARRQPSKFWHERFGLSDTQRVVLHSGSLGGWTGIDDIIDSLPTWPDGWVLVVHTRYDAETSPYVERLRTRADSDRVKFSLKPVSREAYDELIDGADVGLAFYVATGDSSFTQRNIQTIGLSSGKLAYYLRAGLPVIVNGSASIASLIDAEGCGIAVEGAHDIAAALLRMDADSDAFSRRAQEFFERHLDFSRAFDEVLSRIEALDRAA
jgi:glycosyltransferase involved in cell wall biosynthesis